MTDAETQKTELSQWIDSQGFTAQRDAILASADAPQDLFEASEEDLREIGGERLVCCVAAHKGDKVAALLIDAGVPQYRQRFAENDVDLDALRVLEEEDWKALGVSVGHKAKIRSAHKARHPALWESSRPPPETPAAALRLSLIHI